MSELSKEDSILLRKKASLEAIKEADSCKNDKVVLTKLLKDLILSRLFYELFGLRKGDYKIIVGDHGKPYLDVPFYFNISHSKDYWACAFSDSSIGFDIEKITHARMEVAKRFFHINEIEILKNLSAKAQDDMFFRLWSAKESYVKYIGAGLTCPLASFEIVGNRIKVENNFLNLCLLFCNIDSDYSSCITTEFLESVELIKLNLSDII